jgi:hypothetical protein
MFDPNELTPEQWAEAFRRLALTADWSHYLSRPTAQWCSESENYDPTEEAKLILDDQRLIDWNEWKISQSEWVQTYLFPRLIDA